MGFSPKGRVSFDFKSFSVFSRILSWMCFYASAADNIVISSSAKGAVISR